MTKSLTEELHDSDRLVGEIWKWIAMVAVGIILGGAPGYALLAFDAHTSMTRADVDHEIQISNAAIVQNLQDLRDQVQDMSGKLDALTADTDPLRRKNP